MSGKIVVIGSGAREHALVRALLRGASAGGDPRELVAIPGNAGIALEARCVPAAGTAEALAAAAVWEKPDLVVVVGDVNSTVACARVGRRLGVPVAHVEAGLRSFDLDMPEEHNRIETDRLSDLLFVMARHANHRAGQTEDLW